MFSVNFLCICLCGPFMVLPQVIWRGSKYISDKIFKIVPNKICAKQPLKHFIWSIFNTLSHICMYLCIDI